MGLRLLNIELVNSLSATEWLMAGRESFPWIQQSEDLRTI